MTANGPRTVSTLESTGASIGVTMCGDAPLDSSRVEKPVLESARTSDKTAVFLTGGYSLEFDYIEKVFGNPESDLGEDYITGEFG